MSAALAVVADAIVTRPAAIASLKCFTKPLLFWRCEKGNARRISVFLSGERTGIRGR
jgi:hypothetical protein